jgi:membrane-associated protease RseP (regulator of RpoE activity)
LRPWSAGLGFKVAQGAWFGLPRELAPAFIWAVREDSPAQEEGLQVGDLLVAVDGQRSITRNRIKVASETPVSVTVLRGAEELTMTISPRELSGGARDFHLSDVATQPDGSVWMIGYEGDVIRYQPTTPEPWKRYSEADGLGRSGHRLSLPGTGRCG